MSLIEVNYINYLDRINGTYKKILTVNILPKNTVFKTIIKYMNVPRLSPFEPHSSSKCTYVILNPVNKCELLELDDVGLLFNFLTENNLNIHSTFNEVLKHNKKFICYVTN